MNLAVNNLPGTGNPPQTRIRDIFESHRETALRLRTSTAAERIAKLKRLKDAMFANQDAIREAGHADFRKPAVEVDATEILPVIAEINDAVRHLKKWMKPRNVMPTRMMLGTKAWVQHEPKGRCLIISPWNYPVNLSFGPLASAIAAGNTVIIKPSEMTPHAAALMSRIIREVFPEDEVAVIEGEVEVSTELLSLPFDHIFFTGSPVIGKVVMAAAAKHLTSVTLELGGKSPTVIDESADLELAAQTIVSDPNSANGQTCIAPDHIYVHESVKPAFIAACLKVLKTVYGDDDAARQASPFLARIVNSRHTGRIKALLDDAVAKGATALCGGTADADDCFVAPTLLDNLPPDAKIMEEEIFGPLLPIMGYRDLDQVIRKINDAPKPLALYIWSRDEANIEKVSKQTSAGGTCINHAVVHFLHGNLPFGGVNNSGIGSAHGFWGFKAFSHERAMVRTRFMLAKLLFPPFTKTSEKIVKLMMKLGV